MGEIRIQSSSDRTLLSIFSYDSLIFDSFLAPWRHRVNQVVKNVLKNCCLLIPNHHAILERGKIRRLWWPFHNHDVIIAETFLFISAMYFRLLSCWNILLNGIFHSAWGSLTSLRMFLYIKRSFIPWIWRPSYCIRDVFTVFWQYSGSNTTIHHWTEQSAISAQPIQYGIQHRHHVFRLCGQTQTAATMPSR